MDKPIKILHIDPDYKITYFINRPGSLIRSPLPLKDAIKLLKTEQFDLILSEPHNKAILTPQSHMDSTQFKESTARLLKQDYIHPEINRNRGY